MCHKATGEIPRGEISRVLGVGKGGIMTLDRQGGGSRNTYLPKNRVANTAKENDSGTDAAVAVRVNLVEASRLGHASLYG